MLGPACCMISWDEGLRTIKIAKISRKVKDLLNIRRYPPSSPWSGFPRSMNLRPPIPYRQIGTIFGDHLQETTKSS